jgi:hypothetical protein
MTLRPTKRPKRRAMLLPVLINLRQIEMGRNEY